MSDLATLYSLLDSCQVLSLDVFDTALLRRVDEPIVVFELIAREYRHRHPDASAFAFAAERQAAEARARGVVWDRSRRGDVVLDDIYASIVLPSDWNGDVLRELELELEALMCVVNPLVHALYRRAIESNKRVAFVSDMYLPVAFIEELLGRAGYAERALVLVSSAEDGESKGSGALYRRLIDRLRVEPGAILHVGDNEMSDVTMARRRGLTAAHYPRCAEHAQSPHRRPPSREPAEAIQRGLLYNRFHAERGQAGTSFWYRVGYEMVGPAWDHFAAQPEQVVSALGASAVIMAIARLLGSVDDARGVELRRGQADFLDDLRPLRARLAWLRGSASTALSPLERMQRWPTAEEHAELSRLDPACAWELPHTRLVPRRA